MTQQQETSPATKSECKPTSMSQFTKTPYRFRANSKTKDSPKQEVANGVSLSPDLKARAKSEPPDGKSNSSAKTRRSLNLNKPKSAEDAVRSQQVEEVKVLGRSVNRPVVEQLVRPRRQRLAEANNGKNEDGVVDKKKKELEKKLILSENLVKDLQSEVLALKAELDKAQSLNAELEKQNKKLSEDVIAAEAKTAALSSREKVRI